MNLEQKANQIRDIVIHQCSGKEKQFLGGPPYTDHIVPGLQRYNEFLETNVLPDRRRVSLASVVENSDGDVIGYQSTTVINDGTPTEYEKTFIGLTGQFTYGILKYIVVNPEFRNGTVARPLLRNSLEITANFGVSSWVADVNAENRPMLVFLRRYGMEPVSTWTTPNGTEMIRMGTGDVSRSIVEILKIKDE